MVHTSAALFTRGGVMRVLIVFFLLIANVSAFAHGALVAGTNPSYPMVYGVTSVNQSTPDEAERAALQACAAKGYRNCTLILSFQNTCADFFTSYQPTQHYSATGDGVYAAHNNAYQACSRQSQGHSCNATLGTAVCDRTYVAPVGVAQATSANQQPSTPQPDPALIVVPSLIGIGLAIFALMKFISASERRKQEAALQTVRERIAAERLTQLNALRAAMPTSPVKSMRATIQTNTYKDDGGTSRFTVDMMLELTETERAIIKEHELDDIVLEDIPLFDKDALEKKQQQIEEHREAFDRATRSSKMLDAKLSEQVDVAVLAAMKKARLITTVGQLVVIPFSRAFDSPHEANEYASLLKTKLLPEMKRLIQKHGQHRQTETVEF